jgi:hypothetical protein
MEVDSLNTLTSHLVDVVVVCPPTGPVTALTSVCGVPMIVHVLAPWVEQRCANVYLCVEEGSLVPKVVKDTFKTALSTSELIVPVGEGPAFVDTALVAYASVRAKSRDTVVISGNAFMTGVSLSELVAYFVASESSASVVLWEGVPHPPVEKSGKKGKGQDSTPVVPNPSPQQVLCALESEKRDEEGGCVQKAVFETSNTPSIAAHRLHLLQPSHAVKGLPILPMGLASRSPCLDLSRAHSLVGVSFVKSWVLDFLASFVDEMDSVTKDDASVRDDLSAAGGNPLSALVQKALDNRVTAPIPNTLLDVIIPAVASCQHWKLASIPSRNIVAKQSPQDQLGWDGQELREFLEAPHWTKERTVAHNNTSREFSPPGWDRVRVTALVIKEAASSSRRIISPTTYEDLIALSYDITNAFGPKSQLEVAPMPKAPICPTCPTALSNLILAKLWSTNASVGGKANKPVGSSYSDTSLPSGVTLNRSCLEGGITFDGMSIRITNSVVRSGCKISGPVDITNSILEEGVVITASKDAASTGGGDKAYTLPPGVVLRAGCAEGGIIHGGSTVRISNCIIRAGARIVGPVEATNAMVGEGASVSQ